MSRILAVSLAAALVSAACAETEDLACKVDLMIGSGGHGHVFVGADNEGGHTWNKHILTVLIS